MQPDRLTTAAFYGVPFVVLDSARQIAQQRQQRESMKWMRTYTRPMPTDLRPAA